MNTKYLHVIVCKVSIWQVNFDSAVLKLHLVSLASNNENIIVLSLLLRLTVLQTWKHALKDLPPWSPPIFTWISSCCNCLNESFLRIRFIENLNKFLNYLISVFSRCESWWDIGKLSAFIYMYVILLWCH